MGSHDMKGCQDLDAVCGVVTALQQYVHIYTGICIPFLGGVEAQLIALPARQMFTGRTSLFLFWWTSSLGFWSVWLPINYFPSNSGSVGEGARHGQVVATSLGWRLMWRPCDAMVVGPQRAGDGANGWWCPCAELCPPHHHRHWLFPCLQLASTAAASCGLQMVTHHTVTKHSLLLYEIVTWRRVNVFS